MASMTTASETTEMLASLRAASADKDATIGTQASTIKDLETSKIQLEADLKAKDVLLTEKEKDLKEAKEEEKMPTWAIAIIVVIGAVLLLVIVTLGVVVNR